MKAFRLAMVLTLASSAISAPMAPVNAWPAAPPPTSNNQGSNAELFQYCADLFASGEFPEMVLGECMGFNLTSEQGFKAHLCDYVRSNDLWADFGVTSYADCVKNIEY